ncbi:MAG: major capsid protein [Gallionella sp.]|nr:major capsid protein [Gallionella sp.]
MIKKLKNALIRKQFKIAAGAGALLAAGSSQAAIDVTGVTAALTDGLTAVGAIGGAVLLVWGTKKVYALISGR